MSYRILITAGGTGGHIFPGIALAQRLRAQSWEVNWLGTAGGMEETLVPKEGIPFEGLPFKGVRGKGLLHAAGGMWNMVRSVSKAVERMHRERPDVVVGFGGYPSFPALMAARLLNIPVVLHEANRVLGMANRFAARWAACVAISFPKTHVRDAAGEHTGIVHTGAPLRDVFEQVDSPVVRYQQRTGPLRILVVGGSQGALALNQAVPEAMALISADQRPLIRHQAGKQHIAALQESYQQRGVEAECVAFIDNMLEAYQNADVLICRAGALTIAEVLAVGLPALYIPLPSAVDQPANAAWCEQKGAGWCVPQTELTAQNLAARIQGWTRDELLYKARVAYDLGVRDGTQRLADICAQVVAQKQSKK